jgi:hypothetical protein
MLVTLRPEGIHAYLVALLVPVPLDDRQQTLQVALGGGPVVFAIQAVAVVAVIAVCVYARRTGAAWPVVVASVLGSFLLATYWHPQDYLALDAAAAIMLAAGPLEAGVLVATAVAILSTPLSPLTNWQPSREMAIAWLTFAFVLLGFLGMRVLIRPSTPKRPETLAVHTP